MAGVRIKVLFFGMVRDVVGVREDTVDLPESTCLRDVFLYYSDRFPRLNSMASSIVLALNQQFSSGDAPVTEGDEVAFLPPVSGGSDHAAEPQYLQQIRDPEGHFFALTRQTIDGTALAKDLLQGRDGAFVNFEGVTRDNTKGRATQYLDYECYEPMAIRVMAEIGRDIVSKYDISRIAIVHRLGRVEISETSVSIVVTSPHRRAAFDAALEGINRLKKTVPIWKKEYFEDGEVWVEGDWDDSVRKVQGGSGSHAD
jgi:molybdopterin synthase catalytic subunit